MKSCVSLEVEQIDRLLCVVSRCQILLEAEVGEFFDIGQKFLREVVLTIPITHIDEMKERSVCSNHSESE